MICPKCHGITEQDNKSCSCGWTARGQKKEISKQCAFDDVGYRCQLDGHIATTTHGEGPWYCRTHFARVMGWAALQAAVIDEDTMSAVDKRVNALVPRLPVESDQDWTIRCRDWTRKRLGGLKKAFAGDLPIQAEPGELG